MNNYRVTETIKATEINKAYEEISKTYKDMVFELLDKQIPRAIEFDKNDLNICPVCKNHVSTDDYYCRYCGQRITIEV